MNGRSTDDQGHRAQLLLARPLTLDRRPDPVVRDRSDGRPLRNPISFNEIIISSIVGSGATAGAGGISVNARKMSYTVLAWLLSLIGSLVLSYTIFYGASMYFYDQ